MSAVNSAMLAPGGCKSRSTICSSLVGWAADLLDFAEAWEPTVGSHSLCRGEPAAPSARDRILRFADDVMVVLLACAATAAATEKSPGTRLWKTLLGSPGKSSCRKNVTHCVVNGRCEWGA